MIETDKIVSKIVAGLNKVKVKIPNLLKFDKSDIEVFDDLVSFNYDYSSMGTETGLRIGISFNCTSLVGSSLMRLIASEFPYEARGSRFFTEQEPKNFSNLVFDSFVEAWNEMNPNAELKYLIPDDQMQPYTLSEPTEIQTTAGAKKIDKGMQIIIEK